MSQGTASLQLRSSCRASVDQPSRDCMVRRPEGRSGLPAGPEHRWANVVRPAQLHEARQMCRPQKPRPMMNARRCQREGGEPKLPQNPPTRSSNALCPLRKVIEDIRREAAPSWPPGQARVSRPTASRPVQEEQRRDGPPQPLRPAPANIALPTAPRFASWDAAAGAAWHQPSIRCWPTAAGTEQSLLTTRR